MVMMVRDRSWTICHVWPVSVSVMWRSAGSPTADGAPLLLGSVSVGVDYIQRLRAPLGPLPQVIAAGGLGVGDVDAWLTAGHAAVALGRRVIDVQGPDPALLRWLQTTAG